MHELITKKLIEKYISLFDMENIEDKIIQYAIDKFPDNKNFNEVLMKCKLINYFYSTQIYAITSMAEHIYNHSEKIDKLLNLGCPSVVDIIATEHEIYNSSSGKKEYFIHLLPNIAIGMNKINFQYMTVSRQKLLLN